ncbi:capsule biosynthesis protein [Ectothiorhodospira sp. BSL-9]|uniref:capsule biosynthesis protein n=1 Tax=Ectothiorhodospira sp. BSL-9 TaxID=1442136 RepID=UPI00143C5CFE|nr:capsular biosynthesis protein [Ectothiorhodospira sp. BSL-9]
MGPFFWRLKKDLEAVGARVDKVNFCAGDQLFYPRDAIPFRGSFDQWPDFLSGLLTRQRYDAVMLFGDCRPYHRVVPHLIRFMKTRLYVFEEGYLRPDHITLERDGVNSFSSLPRDPEVYRRFPDHSVEQAVKQHTRHAFAWSATFAVSFALWNFFLAWRFPRYRHHRSLNPFKEAFYWCRGAARKLHFSRLEAPSEQQILAPDAPPFFLVPLQTHNDAQITVHSDFESIEEFIGVVLRSFVESAPAGHRLVFKHHPLDRGYTDYTRLIKRLAQDQGVADRVFYVHDLHLPKLLDHARGTVVINSTVGLSSILHGTPVCVLGDPVYHMPGLTHQGALNGFWKEPGQVDKKLFQRFRAWLLAHNQANGNFYERLDNLPGHTGVIWPPCWEWIRCPSPPKKPPPRWTPACSAGQPPARWYWGKWPSRHPIARCNRSHPAGSRLAPRARYLSVGLAGCCALLHNL